MKVLIFSHGTIDLLSFTKTNSDNHSTIEFSLMRMRIRKSRRCTRTASVEFQILHFPLQIPVLPSQ